VLLLFVLDFVPKLHLVFHSHIYLVVNDEGIRIQDPLINEGMIPWSEMRTLRIYPENSTNRLEIFLRDPSTILAQQNRVQALYLHLNMRFSYGISLPTPYLTMSSDALFTQITQRYAAELDQHEVRISDFRRRRQSVVQEQGQ
jgi:hypothetical protein